MLLFSVPELSITLVRMGISFSVLSLKKKKKKGKKRKEDRAARGGFLKVEVTLFILVTSQIDKQN